MPFTKRGHIDLFSHTHTKIIRYEKNNKHRDPSCQLAIFHHTICLIVPEIISRPDINSNLNFCSSRSIELKYILPWNISQMITKTIPISLRIVISYVMKCGISFRV